MFDDPDGYDPVYDRLDEIMDASAQEEPDFGCRDFCRDCDGWGWLLVRGRTDALPRRGHRGEKRCACNPRPRVLRRRLGRQIRQYLVPKPARVARPRRRRVLAGFDSQAPF